MKPRRKPAKKLTPTKPPMKHESDYRLACEQLAFIVEHANDETRDVVLTFIRNMSIGVQRKGAA